MQIHFPLSHALPQAWETLRAMGESVQDYQRATIITADVDDNVQQSVVRMRKDVCCTPFRGQAREMAVLLVMCCGHVLDP